MTGFNFGSTPFNPTSSSSTFGFGSNITTTTASGLATGLPTGGLFGSKPTATTTTSTFSFSNPFTPASSASPFSFGTNTAVSSSPFTLGASTFKGFGTAPFQPQLQQQQQLQQQSLDTNVALYMAVCAPAYFNDERDEVLKKWNQLQAVWGAGKGYFAPNVLPVNFSPDNPFCRFKAVGYIKLPAYSEEDGFVELIIARKEAEVRSFQQQIVDSLVRVFEGCQVCVDLVHPVGEAKTRMCIYVQQRNPNGETKKVQAWLVYNQLNSVIHKTTVQNLCIESVTPLVSLTESQMKEYLQNPPQGIDPMIWDQGKRANPDPKKYLPVPIVGFQDIKARFKAQEEESSLLQGELDVVAENITKLQDKLAKLTCNLHECKRNQLTMAHRVLKLVVKQEVERKRGVPIEQGEEHLRMLFEALHAQLMAPTQYMGRLNELLSQLSVLPGLNGNGGQRMAAQQHRYTLDASTEKNLQQFLVWEQDAIKEVVQLLKKDLSTCDALLELNKKK